MRFLDNLPITRKVLLALGVMGTSGLGATYFAVSNLAALDRTYAGLVNREAVAALQLARANTSFLDAARLVGRAAAADTPAEVRDFMQRLAEARRQTDERIEAALQAMPELAEPIAGFRAANLRAREVSEEIHRLALAGETAAAKRMVAERYDSLMTETRNHIRGMVERGEQHMARESAAASVVANRTYWLSLAGGLAGVVVAMTLAVWMMVAGVSRPIGRIADRMRTLAEGERESPVPGAGRKDEVGRMAEAVEGFRLAAVEQARLAATVAAETEAKQRRAAQVDALVRDFEAEAALALRAVASASTELDATARAMQQTAGAGTERATSLAAASEQASANVQTAAASAEEMAASIAEVARQVTETARVARGAAENARATDAAMASLAEAAGRIGQVVQLISGIAGQTNLLALNATIEAARAGEAGKGFAVVASEVKSLAAQTSKATEDISSQIAAMQSETTRAVEAIRIIARTIEEMDALSTQVAAAAEEQAAAVQEIGRAVAEAAAGTQDVSRHAAGVTDGAQQTGVAATQVSAASGELAEKAEVLRGQVDRFLGGIRAA